MNRLAITLVVFAAATVAACAQEQGGDAVEPVQTAALPTPAELATMPAADREQLKTRLMNEAAGKPDAAVDEVMDMTREPVLYAAGSFSGADAAHSGSGTARVYRLPDSSHIVRLEDFRVTNGPALIVALAAHPDPGKSEDVEKGYINIGRLKANSGNQNYAVPAEFDVLSFGSVVIWCETFGVMFAAAPLKLY